MKHLSSEISVSHWNWLSILEDIDCSYRLFLKHSVSKEKCLFKIFVDLSDKFFPVQGWCLWTILILTQQKQSLHLVFGIWGGKLKQVVITEGGFNNYFNGREWFYVKVFVTTQEETIKRKTVFTACDKVIPINRNGALIVYPRDPNMWVDHVTYRLNQDPLDSERCCN